MGNGDPEGGNDLITCDSAQVTIVGIGECKVEAKFLCAAYAVQLAYKQLTGSTMPQGLTITLGNALSGCRVVRGVLHVEATLRGAGAPAEEVQAS